MAGRQAPPFPGCTGVEALSGWRHWVGGWQAGSPLPRLHRGGGSLPTWAASSFFFLASLSSSLFLAALSSFSLACRAAGWRQWVGGGTGWVAGRQAPPSPGCTGVEALSGWRH